MLNKLGIIFFLSGFIIFSFSGTICSYDKLKSQELTELLGNIAEEEDETSKEDGTDTQETLLELYHNVALHYIQLQQQYPLQVADPLPLFETLIHTPPPQV